jgi:DNA/RNA endonuclease YhcR with UshA esterase domain
LDILQGTTTVGDISGVTDYVIGGLRVTSTQNVPGFGPVTFVYVLGRAEISTVNRSLFFGTQSSSVTAPGEVSSLRSRYGVAVS